MYVIYNQDLLLLGHPFLNTDLKDKALKDIDIRVHCAQTQLKIVSASCINASVSSAFDGNRQFYF